MAFQAENAASRRVQRAQSQEAQRWRILPSNQNPQSKSGRTSSGWTNMGLYKLRNNNNAQGQRRLTRA